MAPGVPEVPGGDDVVADRTRVVSIGMAAVFAACALFALIRLGVHLATGLATPWWANAAAAVAIAAIYAWSRRAPTQRSGVAVHATALVASVALIVPVAYGMTSSKWWVALVGFSVLLMGRRREAIVWTTVSAVLIPVAALLEGRLLVPNAAEESDVERAFAGLFFAIILFGITGTFRRVARQRAAQLAETAALLTRANTVKSRFLAHISHEVRTPLHGVIAMTDLAAQGEASPTVRHHIQTAQRSARTLLALLNNILDVTRAEADALSLEQRPFDLHAALADVLAPLATQARGKGLEFVARASPGVAAARLGDRLRVTQIVLNLVNNALKFTTSGRVEVHLSEVPGNPDRVRLAVSDTGVGIPEDKLSTLFEPFTQARASDASVNRGAGLGLAIVRQLALLMDGSVHVASKIGVGSTFTLEVALPCDPATHDASGPEWLLPNRPAGVPSSAPPRLEAVDKASQGRPLRVLVCEDNPVNRTVILAMLGRLGHCTTIAEDGERAAAILRVESFDLIVTDIEMPGMDGLALTRWVRERERGSPGAHVPIVGATAHVGEEEQHRLLESGMDGHLPKPFTLTELSTAIERAMARASPS